MKIFLQVLTKDATKIYKVQFEWCLAIYTCIALCILLSNEVFFNQEIGLVADSLRLGGAILKVVLWLATLSLMI